jgi:catechol 2,3-dioxygenase-like lactoylglutathione lyase family enzyme
MRLSHLGLPVHDVAQSRQFYETYFGFDAAIARRYDDATVIIRNSDGFDLALHAVEQVGRLPDFLHFGFAVPLPGEVRDLLRRLESDGYEIIESDDEPDYVAFKVRDPDGHRVETYWEPARPD